MEIIRHTSLGKMVPCRSAQCNHSYCVSCSTAVLVILVILIVLLIATVETGVWVRGRVGGVAVLGGMWICAYCVCIDIFFVYTWICLCMHACVCMCTFMHV